MALEKIYGKEMKDKALVTNLFQKAEQNETRQKTQGRWENPAAEWKKRGGDLAWKYGT